MKFLVCVLMVLSSSFLSLARIGESVAECEKRYGKAIEVNKKVKSLTFRVEDIWISAHFKNKKCSTIMYVTGEKDPLTVGQATYLLTNNVKGGWDLVPNHASLVWDSKVGGYSASLCDGTLIVTKKERLRVKKSVAEIIERVKNL